MTISLGELNALPAEQAARHFRDCCGSTRWARAMAAGRPYPDMAAMLDRGDELWRGLAGDDWEEAFARHPRIGERATAGSEKAREWSAGEQRTASASAPATQAALAEANAEYERRFGRTYIICATGRSGDAILADLMARLGNDAERERAVAAEEQRKITRLRLEKLCRG